MKKYIQHIGIVIFMLFVSASASADEVEANLYSTTFTEWTGFNQNAKESETTVFWTTNYSKENLEFTIYNTQISAINANKSKFPNWESGYLMAAKSSTPYVMTSSLKSITKVKFVHGATGSNRGWKLEAKGDGDSDWVTISDDYATTQTGTTVEKEINRTNCQLRFTNLNKDQNAYLFSLDIYGKVDAEKVPMLGSFKIGDTSYTADDIFSVNSDGDMVAKLKLDDTGNYVSESNPLTDIVATSGTISSTTYATSGNISTVTIVVKTSEGEQKYILTIRYVKDLPVAKNDQGIYVVDAGNPEHFLKTLKEVNSVASSSTRTVIFLPDGTYDLEEKCLTAISGDNISIVGQSMEGTIIKNTPTTEGIAVTATLYNSGANTYLQDLTLQNAYPYDGSTGRAVCLQDKGSNTICKNVELKSYQDTYYSNANSQFYFEDSNIHGTVDFICGQGDVFFNNCTITIEKRSSGCTITAPYTDSSNSYGYVFNNCTINSLGNTSYNYGRAWGGKPRCAYINTTLLQPNCLASSRWTTAGMNVAADKFVEYNTMNESGSDITPSSNKLTFTYTDKDDSSKNTSNTFETILTADEAAGYALDKVFTTWTPNTLAAQKSVEGLKLADNTLSWTATDGVTNYAVFKDDVFQGFTTSTTYVVDTEEANYKVRAANEMGGLGEAASAGKQTGISSVAIDEDAANTPYYNIMGVQVPASTKGLLIHNGKKIIVK